MEKLLSSGGTVKSAKGFPAGAGPMTGRLAVCCHTSHFFQADKPGDGAGEQKGVLFPLRHEYKNIGTTQGDLLILDT